MRVAFLDALDAREPRVLSHLPIGITSPRERIAAPIIKRGTAVVISAETGEHRRDLAEERGGVRVRRAFPEGVGMIAAGIADENSRRPRLRAGHVPRRLIAGIGKTVAIALQRNPMAARELDVELRIGSDRQLANRGEFQ